jgi:hypothetical protein
VAARFKAWVCRRSLDRNAGSIATGGMDVLCCTRRGLCEAGRSPIQRSPTECGVFGCDRAASIMGGPGPPGAVEPYKNW